MAVSSEGEPVSFESDVKPLFRETDRESMESHFDLWAYEDVKRAADRILATLEEGTMPCDGAWPEDQVEVFRTWVSEGMPA